MRPSGWLRTFQAARFGGFGSCGWSLPWTRHCGATCSGGSMREPDHQKENPDSLAGEIGVEGIEALPKRVERYGKARKSALDVAEYMQGLPGQQAKDVSQRVMACGDYLLFRHFFTVDKVKLHAAQFCKAHLLCPLCAIRRGAKALGPTWSAGKLSGCSGPPCARSWSL